MKAIDIQALLTATPFKPFKLLTTRTGTYAITDPSRLLLTTTAIYLAREWGSDGIATEVLQVPLAQISRIDVIE